MLKIILVQSFCPLKIKITQFPDGVRLKVACVQTSALPQEKSGEETSVNRRR